MFLFRCIVLLFGMLISVLSFASMSGTLYSTLSGANNHISNEFAQLHIPWIGSLTPCIDYPITKQLTAKKMPILALDNSIQVCGELLRNAGNAPFILAHAQPTKKLIVLFHGLSDSPYYLRSIAQELHAKGHTVVVGLLPGHGVNNPTAVLHDPQLAQIWREYVQQVIATVRELGTELYVGGFSSGGTLATDYMLDHLANVDGLMLFSGALRLAENAETLSKIPFAKWISKIIDGDYVTTSQNPFKYPEISNHAALILMDIIRSVRKRLDTTSGINIPIFAAHSQYDQITPILGIQELISVAIAPHTLFEIAESMHVCHANLPLNQAQVSVIGLDDPNPLANCDVVKANPVYGHMMAMAVNFLAQ